VPELPADDPDARRRLLAEWSPAAAVAALAALAYLAASWLVDPRLVQPAAANVWFDSDLPYRLEAMQRPGGWDNGGAHPLFPTLGHLLLAGAMALTGQGDPLRAAGIAGAALGGLFVALLYALFRRMRLTRTDATLFAAIGATSSGALFWFPVPESFGLAGTGVALALLVAASAQPSAASLAGACVASGASVLTNGAVGLLAVAAHNARPRLWGRGLTILLLALGAMTAAWALQEWSFRTPFFLGDRLLEYRQHTFPVSLERTGHVARGLLVHSVVAPALRNERPSFRNAEIASSGAVGAIATLAWLALLVLGGVATVRLARRGEHPHLALTALGGLALTGAMHLTLGREMFLYALDVLPLLLVLAAASAHLARARRIVRLLALLLLVAGLANNAGQLARAAEAARALATQRLEAVRLTPGS
jgi:hypothetical protein